MTKLLMQLCLLDETEPTFNAVRFCRKSWSSVGLCKLCVFVKDTDPHVRVVS